MPLEPITLSTLLVAGAALSVGTVVREVTKDCYTAVKAKVVEFFGPPAADNLGVLEQTPMDAVARDAIMAAAEQVTPAQLEALTPLIDAFKEALAHDEDARRLAHERGRIDLALNIDGNIEIARIDGVTGMNVRAQASGNFSLTDITMARSSSGGN